MKNERSAFYVLGAAGGFVEGYMQEDGSTTTNISFAKHFTTTTEAEEHRAKFLIGPGFIIKYVQATYNVLDMG